LLSSVAFITSSTAIVVIDIIGAVLSTAKELSFVPLGMIFVAKFY
jgi:hypothetical protein